MKSIFVWACLILTVLFQPGESDIYLHTPPGSNNRLSGEGAQVTNANRLFDSQVNYSHDVYNLKQFRNPFRSSQLSLNRSKNFYDLT